jgi:hypothetical protein
MHTYIHIHTHTYRAEKGNKEVVDLISDDESEAPAPKAQTGMYLCMYVCMYFCISDDKSEAPAPKAQTGMYVCIFVSECL